MTYPRGTMFSDKGETPESVDKARTLAIDEALKCGDERDARVHITTY